MKKHLLILENDAQLAKILKQEFEERHFTVVVLDSARSLPTTNEFSHAIIDLRLANGELGLDAISKVKSFSPNAKIIVFSGYGSITTAVEAIKRGAIDYLTKPTSFAEIEKAFNNQRIQQNFNLTRRSLSEIEHEYIEFMLTKNNGNISKTAKDLGLHRQSLQRKLKKYI